MVYSGITANNAVQIYKDFAAAMPDAKLYGPDGVAESGFSDPKEGGIPADVGLARKVTVATLSPDEYPPEGQQFFSDFTRSTARRTRTRTPSTATRPCAWRWTRSSAPRPARRRTC